MPLPSSPRAYDDCYEAWDRAVAECDAGGLGARIRMDDYNTSVVFRNRMNYARMIRRRESMTVYPFGHPQYNASEYDAYRVTIEPMPTGEYFVYIRKYATLDEDRIEAIPVDETERTGLIEDQSAADFAHEIEGEINPEPVQIAAPTRRPV